MNAMEHDTPGTFSGILCKKDNFYDVLFALLYMKPFQEKGSTLNQKNFLLRNKVCSVDPC